MHQRAAWPEPGWHPKPGQPLNIEYWDGGQWSKRGPVGYQIEDSLYNFDVVLRGPNHMGPVRTPGATGRIVWNGPCSDESVFLAFVLWDETDDGSAETGLLIFEMDRFDLFTRTTEGDRVPFKPPKSVAGRLLGGVARIIGAAPGPISAPGYVTKLVRDRLRSQSAEGTLPSADAPRQAGSPIEHADDRRVDDRQRPSRAVAPGLTGGQHRSIKTMMQDRAAPETVSALLGAARDPNAVVRVDTDYPGGSIVISMSTTTPGVGMLVAWAPSLYVTEWLQTTEQRPCDGYKVTLMDNGGKNLGCTFVAPADLAGMTGDPSGRIGYLQHKFQDDLRRFGPARVASWS